MRINASEPTAFPCRWSTTAKWIGSASVATAVMVQSLDRLSHDTATLYHILRFLQNHGAVLITTKTSLKYELYLTGLENRLLAHTKHTRKKLPWEGLPHAD